jgi:hypothetical protein
LFHAWEDDHYQESGALRGADPDRRHRIPELWEPDEVALTNSLPSFPIGDAQVISYFLLTWLEPVN